MGSYQSNYLENGIFNINLVCLLDLKSSFVLSFSYEEFSSMTIYDFKQKLNSSSDQLGFIPSNLRCLYDISLDEINDTKPLEYFRLIVPIFFDAYLRLLMVVHQKTYPIVFNKLKIRTILQLKSEISYVTRISIEDLYLEHNGQIILEDNQSLENYGIKHDSVITQSKVSVKFVSKYNPLICECHYLIDESIDNLVKMIRSILFLNEEEVILKFNGKKLDEKLTINNYFSDVVNIVNVEIKYLDKLRLYYYNNYIECNPFTSVNDYINILIEKMEGNIEFPEKNFLLMVKGTSTRFIDIADIFENYLVPNNSEITIVEAYRVFILDSAETLFTFDVDENLPILMLKHNYFLITGKPVAHQQITINGDLLSEEHDNYSMKRLNIKPEMILKQIVKIPFKKEITEEARISREYLRVKTNKDTPKWRILRHGLNFEGTCLNRACTAYKEKVFSPIETEIFDMKKDLDLVKCPICTIVFIPEAFGFINCKYSYAVIKEIREEVFEIIQKQKWYYVENCFKYFVKHLNDRQKWTDLRFFIKMTENTSGKDKKEEFCGFCKNVILNKKRRKMNCRHIFHYECEGIMGEVFNLKCYLCNK